MARPQTGSVRSRVGRNSRDISQAGMPFVEPPRQTDAERTPPQSNLNLTRLASRVIANLQDNAFFHTENQIPKLLLRFKCYAIQAQNFISGLQSRHSRRRTYQNLFNSKTVFSITSSHFWIQGDPQSFRERRCESLERAACRFRFHHCRWSKPK